MNPSVGVHRSSFILHRSLLIVALVILYGAATVALFARFFWLNPTSAVSLLTIGLAAFCYRETRRDPMRGLLVLSFATPLVGSLPYLAPERCPPPLLLIVAGFALGQLFGLKQEADQSGNKTENRNSGVSTAVSALFLLFAISGVLTAWRYLNNFPFGGWPTLHATINVRQESASDALGVVWQIVVVMLSGPLVFLLASTIARNKRVTGTMPGPSDLVRWARVLLSGMFLACVVGILQMFFFPSFGNDPYWVKHSRINATFTDPNGLGVFVALVFPLMPTMVTGALPQRDKLLAAAVILLSVVMLAGSGSRTGAAGVLIAALLFPAVLALRFKIEGDQYRQRVVFASLAFLVVVAAFTPLDFQGKSNRWVLVNRLARTREVIARQGLLAPVVRERWPLWEPAAYIAFHYPIGGIGLGAFHCEVKNVARLEGRRWPAFDNANNLYLQMASELGLVGLAVVVAVFAMVLTGMVRVIRSPRQERESCFIYISLTTAWLSFLILFLTGPHVFFEQIQIGFWLFAAVFAWHPDFYPAADLKRRRLGVALATASVAVVAAYQIVHAFGDLSLAGRRTALGLEQSEGFYGWETDETGRRFRWTGEEARLIVPTTKGEIRIEMQAKNPDLAARPLAVWISLSEKPIVRHDITSPSWRWVRIPVRPNTPNPAELRIRVERTWCPRDFRISYDKRALGVAISQIENDDPSAPLPP